MARPDCLSAIVASAIRTGRRPAPGKLPAMRAAFQMFDIPEIRARISPVEVAPYHEFPEFKVNGHRSEVIRNGFLQLPPAAKTNRP